MNGVELFTRTVGDGPDVVVLHGGPGAHHDYLLPQYDALASGRRLRYYDQRGGGRSPVPRAVPVGWREHVADLNDLVSHWQAEPVHLLGYSWGGLLAILYATEYPFRVASLSLVSPAPISAAGRRAFESRFAERMRAPRIIEERAALTASDLRESDPEAYRQRAFALSVAGYFHEFDRVQDLTPFRVTGRTQTAVWQSLGEYDLEAALRRISVRARVFHGRHDPIPLETATTTAELLQADLITFEHSGHCPHVEEPKEFRRELDGWLPRR